MLPIRVQATQSGIFPPFTEEITISDRGAQVEQSAESFPSNSKKKLANEGHQSKTSIYDQLKKAELNGRRSNGLNDGQWPD